MNIVNVTIFHVLTVCVDPLRTVVPYMCHGKIKFNTCEQIVITLSSLA